ncbi:MAG TPA: hypothetical protein VII06_19185 [Chloroflexota bacterium]|jgi:endogenous inhibitor of DNA gyrase (YacG/DUF329 family)
MADAAADRARLSELGRGLAAARRVVGPIQCAECGREVVATTAGRYKRRYCSSACQQRAYRRAHAAEYNARQRKRRAEQRGDTPDGQNAL